MTAITVVLFNLIVNAVFSFLFALLLVHALVRLLRAGPGIGRTLLWLVPITKVVWDLVRGIPSDSFLWQTLAGRQQDLGSFQFGFGLRPAEPPTLQLHLGALSDGAHYSQSAGDLTYRAVSNLVSPAVPAVVVGVVLAGVAWRLAARLYAFGKFAFEHRRLLRRADRIDSVRTRWREVGVFASPQYHGAPFAAGTLRPFVLFPRSTHDALAPDERRAAILHEIAHVERFDPTLILVLSLVSDVLWFLPGLRGLLRRLSADLELCADARAVDRGATRESLAAALLSVAEHMLAAPAPAAGLPSGGTALALRVETLLDPPGDRSRAVYRHWAGRLAVLVLFISSILLSVFLGN